MIPFVATKWYEIGIELLDENKESELEVIKAKCGTDVKKCCLEMFIYWRNSHTGANWYHVVKALKSPAVNLKTVAAVLEKKFSINGTYAFVIFLLVLDIAT